MRTSGTAAACRLRTRNASARSGETRISGPCRAIHAAFYEPCASGREPRRPRLTAGRREIAPVPARCRKTYLGSGISIDALEIVPAARPATRRGCERQNLQRMQSLKEGKKKKRGQNAAEMRQAGVRQSILHSARGPSPTTPPLSARDSNTPRARPSSPPRAGGPRAAARPATRDSRRDRTCSC